MSKIFHPKFVFVGFSLLVITIFFFFKWKNDLIRNESKTSNAHKNSVSQKLEHRIPELEHRIPERVQSSSISKNVNSWQEALDYVVEMESRDRDEFLYDFLSGFQFLNGEDRVGFLSELGKIKGPGEEYKAMLSNCYSHASGLRVADFLKEIRNFGLTDEEEATLLTAANLDRDSFLDAGFPALLATLEDGALKSSLVSYYASLLASEEGEASLKMKFGELSKISDDAFSSPVIVSHFVRSSPEESWVAFEKFVSGDELNTKDAFEGNIKTWVQEFLNHKNPSDLLELISSSSDGQVAVEIADVASRYQSFQDSAILGDWILSQPKGSVRDVAIKNLVKSLFRSDYEDQAKLWISEIASDEVKVQLLEEFGVK
ncbi:hypothetical protein [Roseibacillus ishigakijimensis]|uniref:Uncharacterized protein n=1 Tax=Roseibacillus ishigakijimensis TaxID=454146 RepID=A0A934RRK5_9BACT|nr:hypothetical protein [Roseibacillus ishigakijimensis]MBK1835660.1 hypothetical protein [Roseibacillus ishigakijimensis]